MAFASGDCMVLRREKRNHATRHSWALVCLMLVFAFCLVPFPLKALAKSEAPIHKTQYLWNREVSYRLIHQKDSKRDHDGEAFFRQEGEQKINYVILNSAYFSKEADIIFARFQDLPKKNEAEKFSSKEWSSLEQLLLTGADFKNSTDPELQHLLRDLQHQLEYQAWHGLFQEAQANTHSFHEAKKYFAQRFTEARLQTIEYHEAAHLLDMKDGVTLNSAAFERFTELNAFYTELAYGSRPHDVMAQALSGLREEWRQGRNVDYSFPKVATFLGFLKKRPKWGTSQDPRPFSGRCIELLAQMKRADFIALAKGLYQRDFPHSFQMASHP